MLAPQIMKYWKDLSNLDSSCFSSYLRDHNLDNYVFRGLPEDFDNNLLASSFDRTISILESQGRIISNDNRWLYEAYLLYEFKRRAHFYLRESSVPNPNDFLEWLSLLRHYGAPSRLIDFTYSFYIGLYFAIYRARKDKDACMIAINWEWLVDKVESELLDNPGREKKGKKKLYFQDPKVFHRYAMVYRNGKGVIVKPKSFIIPVRPFRSNERIHMQQGLFLCPANINLTFEKNLTDSRFSKLDDLRKNIKRIVIPKEHIPKLIFYLKKMNIGAEALYSGLSGFSESLNDLFYRDIESIYEDRYLQAISLDTIF